MKHYFKCNTEEFSDIHCLSIVEHYRDLEQLQKVRRSLETERPATTHPMHCGHAIIKRITEVCPQEFELIKSLILIGKAQHQEDDVRKLLAVIRILLGFSRFNIEAFTEWVSHHVGCNTPADWEEAVVENTKALQAAEEAILECVRLPPRLSAPGNKTEACQYAVDRARAFVTRWREVAPQFETPVTVYGRAIASIADGPLRELWKYYYQMLGLSPSEVGIYQHTTEASYDVRTRQWVL